MRSDNQRLGICYRATAERTEEAHVHWLQVQAYVELREVELATSPFADRCNSTVSTMVVVAVKVEARLPAEVDGSAGERCAR